jgi:hypothetical protein
MHWLEWYELASEYREHNGNLLIPREYVTVSGDKLGRWIERQRAAYHGKGRYILDKDQIYQLESIGMVWQLEVRTKVSKWMELCEEYSFEYGDLCVPKTAVYHGYALGEWICMQRKLKKRNKLEQVQIQNLEKLGMCWSMNEQYPWNDWYALASEYYRRFGNLQIPVDYITPAGRKLGRWICVQRDRYYGTEELWMKRIGRKPLNVWQITLLDEIGMRWTQYRSHKANSDLSSCASG